MSTYSIHPTRIISHSFARAAAFDWSREELQIDSDCERITVARMVATINKALGDVWPGLYLHKVEAATIDWSFCFLCKRLAPGFNRLTVCCEACSGRLTYPYLHGAGLHFYLQAFTDFLYLYHRQPMLVQTQIFDILESTADAKLIRSANGRPESSLLFHTSGIARLPA